LAIRIGAIGEAVHIAVHTVVAQAFELRASARCARAVVAQFNFATRRASIASIGIAIVALIRAVDDAVTAGEDAHAWSTGADVTRLDRTERGASVARCHVAVVTLFGARHHAVATIERANARSASAGPALFEAAIVGAAISTYRVAVVTRFRTFLDAVAASRVEANEHFVGGNGCVIAVFLDLDVIRTGRQIHSRWGRCGVDERTRADTAVVVGREHGRTIGSPQLENRVVACGADIVIRRERLNLDVRIRRNGEGKQVLVIAWRNRPADEDWGYERTSGLATSIVGLDFWLRFNPTIGCATVARNQVPVVAGFGAFPDAIAAKRIVFHFELISGDRSVTSELDDAHVVNARREVFRGAIAGDRRVNLRTRTQSAVVVAHEDCRAVRSAKFDDGIVA